LKPNELKQYTVNDYAILCEGWQIKQQREWERFRWLGAVILQPHAKKGKRIKPKDLMHLEYIDGRNMEELKELAKNDKDKMKEIERILNLQTNGS
jgi:hypothetical protein